MIHILYLHNSACISGGERSLLQLWATLDRAQFVPHLFIPSEGPLADEARRMGVDVTLIQVPALRPLNIFSWLKAGSGLVREVKAKNIAIIHSYSPRNNLLAVWAGWRCGVRVIWHERNMLWGREPDITRMLLRFPDAVICNSRAVAGRFLCRGKLPSRVRVILNGVDLECFHPTEDKAAAKRVLGCDGMKVVGLVSNLNVRKGVQTFLEIAALVLRCRQDVMFVVVGGAYGIGDGQVDALKAQVRTMGIEGHVVWTGFKADVQPYLAAFDVASHVTRKEACSRAILESMAAGVPVVAFSDGGNPELIDDQKTGVLVPVGVGDVEVFASRLMAFLDDEAGRRRMGLDARRRAETFFDIKMNTAVTQALYAELMKGRHADRH